ncbi:metallophosphoesterase [Thalassotalea fusca]
MIFFLFSGLILTATNTVYATNLDASSNVVDAPITDGPYVSISNSQLNYHYICQDKVLEDKRTISTLPHRFAACGLLADIPSLALRTDLLEYHGDFKVAALSDLHGQYDLMITLLVNNGIISAQGNWTFGKGHFVITGDVFDRGDKVTEILWFLYRLEQQAVKAGGKVHLLLGNHEVMVLNGDLRYLHPKYVKAAKLLETEFAELFSKTTVLGQWLRSKSVLVKINNALYAHGGFHPELAQKNHSLQEINSVFKKHLIKAELPKPREGLARFLHKSNGPIWYRGYFKDDGATSEEIDLLLNHFDIEHLIVGHTSQNNIETRYQGKVIAIDSSIKKGEYGELLFIEGKKLTRGTLSGEHLLLN